jgi:hypothetical protein
MILCACTDPFILMGGRGERKKRKRERERERERREKNELSEISVSFHLCKWIA